MVVSFQVQFCIPTSLVEFKEPIPEFCKRSIIQFLDMFFQYTYLNHKYLTLTYCPHYRLPLARLWVTHSIWQLSAVLPPPLLHAVTWSLSISAIFHTLLLIGIMAQSGQLDSLLASAILVCLA